MKTTLWLLVSSALLFSCSGPPKCDPTSCKTGCCAGTACVGGAEVTACGLGGFACNDCNASQRLCQSGACIEDVSKRGRTCTTATVVTLTGTTTTVSGDTGGVTDAFSASCGGGGSTELVYRIDLTSTATLNIEVRPTDLRLKPVISLRSDCTQAAELSPGCVSAANPGSSAVLTLPQAANGSYFLIVDGAGGSSGPFTMAITRSAAGGDTCTVPLLLNLSPTTEATVKGTLNGFTNASAPTCGGAAGSDVVYRVNTPRTLNVDATVQGASNLTPVLNLRQSSCAGTELACGVAAAAGGTASIQAFNLGTSSYYFWVDTLDANSGEYTMNLRFAPPPPGGCVSPEALVFSNGTLGGTATSSASTSLPDGGGSVSGANCGGLGAPEHVYSFSITQPLNLSATATAAGSGLSPAVYLRSGSCTGIERGCSNADGGSEATLTVGGLTTGTYYLYVDGQTGTQGAYTLNASLTQPVLGDSCGNPAQLVFTNGTAGGTASALGDTSTVFSDTAGTCGGLNASDTVYSFTTSVPLNFSATASSTSGSYAPVLYLRQSSCTATSDRACNAGAVGGAASINVAALTAGTYYLWVDGVAGSSGAFNLQASLTAPPVGDTCLNPKDLVFSNGQAGGTASDTVDLAPLGADNFASCGTGQPGNDLVYRITINQPLNLQATATPASGFQPLLALRPLSCTGTERVCAASATPGAATSLSSGSLLAGTHYLWVDTVGADAGTVMLTASLTQPVVGDGCGNPKTLVFSNGQAGGTASDVGDTTALFDDSTASCGGAGSLDAVYTFTTNTTLNLSTSVAVSAGDLRPALQLKSSCTTTTTRACVAGPADGGVTSLNYNALPAGTHYLWVDGVTGSGAFSINATLQ